MRRPNTGPPQTPDRGYHRGRRVTAQLQGLQGGRRQCLRLRRRFDPRLQRLNGSDGRRRTDGDHRARNRARSPRRHKTCDENAYLASAARNAAGAAEGSRLAKLSGSQLGELVTAFTDAQFSQKQEYEADEYGFEFSVKHGFSPYAMGNSLNKLVELSKGAKASTVQKMFSSHPDSEKRAARMKEKADAHAAAQQQ